MKKKESKLRQRQHEATTEAMLDAAERAMVRYGYERATMQQIAAQTGCAAGTFYLYFKNKQVLFEAILVRHAQAMLQASRAEMAKVSNPLEKIRQSLAGTLGYWQGRGASLRLVFAAWPMRHRAMQDRLSEIGWKDHLKFHRTLQGHLREAQKQGLVRRDLPPGTLMDFIDAVGFGLVETFSSLASPPSVEEQMRILWGLLQGGLTHQERP
jgi:AcrR family transcriptional regulator